MDPLRELPLGFAMALAKNPQAAQRFYAMPVRQRLEVLEQTHGVQSKAEMQALVNGLEQ